MLIQEVLASQKKSIAEVMKATGVSPDEFEWRKVASRFSHDMYVSQLLHRTSPFYFTFDYKDGKEYALFSPGVTSSFGGSFPGTWLGIFQDLQRWVGYVKRELDADDPWTIGFGASSAAATALGALPDTAFTGAELKSIRDALEQFREEAAAIAQLSDSQSSDLSNKLEHLITQAATQTRQNWVLLAFGTLLQFILATPQAQAFAGKLLVALLSKLNPLFVAVGQLPR